MIKKLIIMLLGAFFALSVYAQNAGADSVQGTVEDAETSLEDELFGGDEEAFVTPEQTRSDAEDGLKFRADLKTVELSLSNSKVRFAGALNASLGLNYVWFDPYTKKDDYKKAFLNPKEAVLRPDIGANLFFDARPVENLKLYGKVIFDFPFEKSLTGAAIVPKNPLFPNGTVIPASVSGSPNIKIWELYTDFSARDIAFFRFGKHTVKWGTGYFYSPADVINIGRIDPQEPKADREGAVSLRTHIVIPKTQHNIWLYLLPPEEKDGFSPKYTAGAVKAEFVVGNWELGVGGRYRYEKAPRLLATFSGSIAGKVSVFGEGVFAWGSDHTYHKNDAGLTAYEQKNEPFFQATVGGSYSGAKTHTFFAVQYFYNGFGYEDTGVLKTITGRFEANPNDLEARKAAKDFFSMNNPGRHYIAFSAVQNKIGTEKLKATLFQQFALSELEGLTALKLKWEIYKFVSLETGPVFIYPLSSKSKSEGSIAYGITVKLGGGKF